MGVKEIQERNAKLAAEGKIPSFVPLRTKPTTTRSLPCIYLGESTGQTKQCPTCSGNVSLKLFKCSIHGVCTPTKNITSVACCQGCKDYLEKNAEGGTVNDAVLSIREEFISEFQTELARVKSLSFPQNRFSGRGIVIPAGGWNMLPGVFVTASMLRWECVNSRLPIEVWYIGDEGEYDPIFSHITEGLDVVWRNVSEELRRLGIIRTERLHGWAVKPLALMLSSFSQVVMLDSDCYPVYDPERLWNDSRIADKPAAFWPDNPQFVAGRPLTRDQWSAFGLSPVSTPGFESGQMLVDKERSWSAINAAVWLSDRMDYFDATRADKGKVGIHGDKEIFSIAWNATNTPYYMAPPVKYHEVAFLQHDPDGHVAFVHRCNDKPKLSFVQWKHTLQREAQSSVNFRSTTLHHEHRIHYYIEQLRELLRPNIPGFRDGTQDEQIWREVRVANAYRLPKRMDSMRVIDLGAHAGFFTMECARRGAELVLAVEPYPTNVLQCRMNIGRWGHRIGFYERAAAAPGKSSVKMVSGRKDHTGEPHVHEDGEVSVPTITLDELIDRCDGRVDLLKIDAEGAEYEVLLTSKKLDCVKRITGEFHTHGKDHSPQELRTMLEEAGFTVEMDESLSIGMFHALRS